MPKFQTTQVNHHKQKGIFISSIQLKCTQEMSKTTMVHIS
jgi:hypothetical protein